MAILKGINGGNFSGSVGKVTFRKGLKGDIIASQKAESVSNPKTTPQQEQRMIMKTAITAYSALKNFCTNSFEGVQQGQKSQAEFIKRNLEILRKNVGTHAFTAYNVGGFAPNQYIISKGSLQGINLIYEEEFLISDGGGNGWGSSKVNNWKDFSFEFGLKEDDQISVIALYSNNDDFAYWDEIEQENILCGFAKYKIKEGISNDAVIINDTNNTLNDDVFKPVLINNVRLEVYDAVNKGIYLKTNDFSYIWAACIVVSRKVGNKWLHSTSYLTTAGGKIPEAYKYENVLHTYKPNGTKYLNNATK